MRKSRKTTELRIAFASYFLIKVVAERLVIRAIDGVFDDNLFLFLIETICCDPSSELSCRNSSDEGSQHMFICRINENIPNYLQILPFI